MTVLRVIVRYNRPVLTFHDDETPKNKKVNSHCSGSWNTTQTDGDYMKILYQNLVVCLLMNLVRSHGKPNPLVSDARGPASVRSSLEDRKISRIQLHSQTIWRGLRSCRISRSLSWAKWREMTWLQADMQYALIALLHALSRNTCYDSHCSCNDEGFSIWQSEGGRRYIWRHCGLSKLAILWNKPIIHGLCFFLSF